MNRLKVQITFPLLNIAYIINYDVTIVENMMAGIVQRRECHVPQKTHKIVSTMPNVR